MSAAQQRSACQAARHQPPTTRRECVATRRAAHRSRGAGSKFSECHYVDRVEGAQHCGAISDCPIGACIPDLGSRNNEGQSQQTPKAASVANARILMASAHKPNLHDDILRIFNRTAAPHRAIDPGREPERDRQAVLASAVTAAVGALRLCCEGTEADRCAVGLSEFVMNEARRDLSGHTKRLAAPCLV